MNNDNRVVQGLWVGGRLSALERLCIRSFCAHGHEFHLYHYDELQNVPRVDGLRLMDGADILPRAAIFHHRKFGVVYFSDHFRWELLRQRGGWWMDMDIICMRPLDIAADIAFVRDNRPDRLLNGMLKFPAGHFLPASLANACADVNRIQPWDAPRAILKKTKRRLFFWRDSHRYLTGYDAGGMWAFLAAVRHFGMEKYALPASSWLLPGDPQARDYVASSACDWEAVLASMPQLRFIHLDNAQFAASGTDKDGDYPADSLYETLKRRYGETLDG